MIKPTVGRVVWYHPSSNEGAPFARNGDQPHAAIIARVWTDTCVNLTVFDANGHAHSRTSVSLLQEDAAVQTNGAYAEWTPYQKGQAAKTEALEAKAAPVAPAAGALPRVTPQQIAALMARVIYSLDVRPLGSTSTLVHAFLDGTFYLASGHSACVSPEAFDAGTGFEIAKNNARRAAEDALWKYEGYALFKRLQEPTVEVIVSHDGVTINGDVALSGDVVAMGEDGPLQAVGV